MREERKAQKTGSDKEKSSVEKTEAPKAEPSEKKGTPAIKDETLDVYVYNVLSLEKRASDLPYEARLKSDEELRLSDSVEHSELRREIEKAYRTGGLAKVRELLATSDYAGMVAEAIFNVEEGEEGFFLWRSLIPRAQSVQGYYTAREEDARKLPEKNGLRKMEMARIKQQEKLQKGAEEALHKMGEKGLAEYVRQHKEKLDSITELGEIFLTAYIAATPEKDSLYIDWKDDIKKESKGAISVYFPPLQKVLLAEDIGKFRRHGLLNNESLSAFLEEAGLCVAQLMGEYEVPIDRIYAEAWRGLARVKRGDVIFTEDEVFKLVMEQDPMKRGQLYNKMRDEKRDYTRRFPLSPPL